MNVVFFYKGKFNIRRIVLRAKFSNTEYIKGRGETSEIHSIFQTSLPSSEVLENILWAGR